MKRRSTYFDQWAHPEGSDTLRAAGLPTRISDAGFDKLAAMYPEAGGPPEAGTATRADPKDSQHPFVVPPAESRGTPLEVKRIASLADIPTTMRRMGTGFYKDAHGIWELRPDEENAQGYMLVRKKEERALDFRSASLRSDAPGPGRRTAARAPDGEPAVAPAVPRGARVLVAHGGRLVEGTVVTADGGHADLALDGGGMLDHVPVPILLILPQGDEMGGMGGDEEGLPMGEELGALEEVMSLEDGAGEGSGEPCGCCGETQCNCSCPHAHPPPELTQESASHGDDDAPPDHGGGGGDDDAPPDDNDDDSPPSHEAARRAQHAPRRATALPAVGEAIIEHGERFEITEVGMDTVNGIGPDGLPRKWTKKQLLQGLESGQIELEALEGQHGRGEYPPAARSRRDREMRDKERVKDIVHGPRASWGGGADARRGRRVAALKIAGLAQSELEFLARSAAQNDGLRASAGRVTKPMREAAERFVAELERATVSWVAQAQAPVKEALARAANRDLAMHAFWDVTGQRAGLNDALDCPPAAVQGYRRHLRQNEALRTAAKELADASARAVRVATR